MSELTTINGADSGLNVFVTGATGFIGHHVVTALLGADHHVTACARQPEKLLLKQDRHLDFCTVDYADGCDHVVWIDHLNEVDVVINCVGIIAESHHQRFSTLHHKAPVALFTAAQRQGVKNIIQISALGADEHARTSYHRSKKQADDFLRQLNVDSYILRPSIVYGPGAQSMALFHALAAQPILVCIDEGQQVIQPVHVDDLVACILQCINDENTGTLTLDIVGPQPVSWLSLLRQLRTRLGRSTAKEFFLPGKLLEHSVGLFNKLGEQAISKDSLVMLNQGNSADPHPMTQFLGRPPVDLQHGLFSKPATQAERWHAHLYFMRPLLCLTIAFVWLWSGMVSLFFYPHADSYQLLADAGIHGMLAALTLYGLAIMDIVFGVATLSRRYVQQVLFMQIAIIIGYTLFISFTLPQFWLHPFGPIVKNLPLLLSTVIYYFLEEINA